VGVCGDQLSSGHYLKAIEHPPVALRVALCTASWSGHPIDREVIAATEATGRLLQFLGHAVELDTPTFDYEGWVDPQKVIWVADSAASLPMLAQRLGREIDETALGPTNTAMCAFGRFLARHEMFVMANVANLSEAIGNYDSNRLCLDVDNVFTDLALKETLTALLSATGRPAISLPLSPNSSGLPFGVQNVGHSGREEIHSALAATLEAAMNWSQHRPRPHLINLEER
jgi:amidase